MSQQQSDTIAAMPLEARLTRLQSTVSAIIDLLHLETAAVKAIDLGTFVTLQDNKAELFTVYGDDIRALIAQQNDLKLLPDLAKNKIRNWEKELSVARIENMSTLERAGKSFARLRDRIVQIAKDSALRMNAQYGANGTLQVNSRRAISTGVHDRA
jgi:hypothetical protein